MQEGRGAFIPIAQDAALGGSADGTWTLRVLCPGDVMTFESPDVRIAVDGLYERAFDESATP